jgi:Uma2 family endonuclease
MSKQLEGSTMYWRKKVMAPAPGLMTVDEYFRTPETVKPMELAYGKLRVADSPSPIHQSAVADLFRALDEHVRRRQLGKVWIAPLDVVLNARQALIVQPDLFFISNDRAAMVTDRIYGAPDLVIEVLSPNPRIGQTEERVRWFADNGVRECWLLHQLEVSLAVLRFENERVAARELFTRRQPIASSVLPEFQASLNEILG